MKRISVKIVILVFAGMLTVKAQNLAKDLAPNFAVPNAPAFAMVDENPDNILRPSSVKDVAVAFSDFLGEDDQITLPKAFAIEFSPALLIGGKDLSIDDYKSKAWLYRLQLSLATRRMDETTSSNIALGVRVPIEDETDLRTNQDYIKKATDVAAKIQDIIDEKREEIGPQADIEKIILLPDVIAKKEALERSLKEFISKGEDKKWNANSMDLAFAVRANSSDSLAKNLKFSRVSGWFTKAIGFGEWGQFLGSAYVNYEKAEGQNDYKSSGTLIARLYAGVNKYKIFIDTQGTIIQDEKPKFLADGGFELKVQENIWLEFTAGIESTSNAESTLFTDFKLKFGLQ